MLVSPSNERHFYAYYFSFTRARRCSGRVARARLGRARDTPADHRRLDDPGHRGEKRRRAAEDHDLYRDRLLGAARAPFGVKIINAKLMLNAGIITAPAAAGSYLFRALITPWNTAAPAPDAAHTVEAQSIVNIPAALSLKATVKTIRHKHKVHG